MRFKFVLNYILIENKYMKIEVRCHIKRFILLITVCFIKWTVS